MKKIRSYVEFLNHDYPVVSQEAVKKIKESVQSTELLKSRICMHSSVESALQQMLIVHMKNTIVWPHKHVHPETFLVLEGAVDILFFSASGEVESILNLQKYSNNSGNFFAYIDGNTFHAMRIKQDNTVFLETSLGPFEEGASMNASWCQHLTNQQYLDFLDEAISLYI